MDERWIGQDHDYRKHSSITEFDLVRIKVYQFWEKIYIRFYSEPLTDHCGSQSKLANLKSFFFKMAVDTAKPECRVGKWGFFFKLVVIFTFRSWA